MATRTPWPVKADHNHASFPPEEKIPPAARPKLDAFLNMRVRVAEARDAVTAAERALAQAKESETSGLVEHLRHGGSADTFERPDTQAAQAALDRARQEYQALQVLIGETYLEAARALREVADEGSVTAQADVDTTHRAYLQAIDAVEQKRRDYLRAIGLRYFWAHLDKEGKADASVGQLDVIALRNGPITRVDDGAFAMLRNDAKAHTRIDGTSPAANTW